MRKIILPALLAWTLVGCVVVDDRKPNGPVMKSGGGPPPWAPAHGRRAKEAPVHTYSYHYYPSAGVYLNISTGSYFYLSGGRWQVAATLPSAIVIKGGDYVMLDLDTDKPYLHYEEHKVKYKEKGNKQKGRSKGNKRS
jgi:hypothetical protein